MSALDHCHWQVVHALEKAGWIVAPKPLTIPIDSRHRLQIDIQAENPDQRAILVAEIKCFSDEGDDTVDLYAGIGQYLIYRNWLQNKGTNMPLYLAVPTDAYHGVFRRMAMPVIAEYHVKLIVVDIEAELVVEWLKS